MNALIRIGSSHWMRFTMKSISGGSIAIVCGHIAHRTICFLSFCTAGGIMHSLIDELALIEGKGKLWHNSLNYSAA